MFTGPYGVSEDGTYAEWIAARAEDLCPIPDRIDDVTAGGLPVAYLTAQITLTQAGFEPGKTVLAPAIGGAVGNAVTQLARAQGAGRRFRRRPTDQGEASTGPWLRRCHRSLRGTPRRWRRPHHRGPRRGCRHRKRGRALTGQALAALALDGVLTSLGYSAGRKTTIDVTDLIWKHASMSGFSLFAQSHAVKAAAWATILSLLASGRVKPIVERAYKLDEAAEALRHLIEDRPSGEWCWEVVAMTKRYVHGRIFGSMPPSRSTLTRTIKRFSPGWRYGYLSTRGTVWRVLSAWASAPVSVTVAVPLRRR